MPQPSLASTAPHENILLSYTALARLLGITTDTLRSWARTIDGFPRPRLIGVRAYFLRDEVTAWLHRQPERGRAADAAHA